MHKTFLDKRSTDQLHWVGDGFLVKSMFSYHDDVEIFSPFLLLDYASPSQFSPTTDRRGVGQHPHRGFETVTIVYDGEVQHRDSCGAGGVIGPGDVQWMTAAAGILHEEWHSANYAAKGGPFEMVQLWVNLPKKDKTHLPRYQSIVAKDIPNVELAKDSGMLRVIAGEYLGNKGPALTFTPIDLWDLRLNAEKELKLQFPAEHNALLLVQQGRISVEDESFAAGELAVFGRDGDGISIKSHEESCKILVLAGAAIPEPVVGYGPFVMNTEDEIKQAYLDLRAGILGRYS